eukprot:TRINITY_DN72_c0_g1_i1.p1 TRINITY_DN72_c0_g1~~TRINITY_DN72_c0_g1_i1.p1  ORF type:complete len:221 (+),score=3.57 TRINITY_DN72_c0_g1_i1:39-701(+)
MASLSDLPEEMIREILLRVFQSPTEYSRFRCINRMFRHLIDDEDTWRVFCRKAHFARRDTSQTWRSCFLDNAYCNLAGVYGTVASGKFTRRIRLIAHCPMEPFFVLEHGKKIYHSFLVAATGSNATCILFKKPHSVGHEVAATVYVSPYNMAAVRFKDAPSGILLCRPRVAATYAKVLEHERIVRAIKRDGGTSAEMLLSEGERLMYAMLEPQERRMVQL